MTKKVGRPKGSGNLKYCEQDRQDCIAIARLRLADSELSVWDAVCNVTGIRGHWRHQDARNRRLHKKYVEREPHWLRAARGDLSEFARDFMACVRRDQREFDAAAREVARLIRTKYPLDFG